MSQQAMMRKLQKLQEEMVETQKQIEATLFEASAGGIVTVKVYGNKELSEVVISSNFEAHEPEDWELLGDAIAAACSDAYRQIEAYTKEKMAKYEAFLGGMGGLF